MKKLKLVIIPILGSLILLSCGGSTEPGTPITAKQFNELHYSKDNAGKRFSITGYPFIFSDVTMTGSTISVSIHSEPMGKGESIGSVDMKYKEYKNGIFIPDTFTPDKIDIYDKDGNKLGVNDEIKVSFTMHLNTNRDPFPARDTKDVVDGKIVDKHVPATYYGNGPVDLLIEKVE
ncbi:hypothetical protein [Psychroserpens sp. NJDZ02]|uniref:hypothetical protein n=1 Tax=Psychroserpens sp. NJDZ02 TaxID=2570561 RepID=UPI0010A75D84|nr:hypothetical protein [Psychroserpens sp. NJDZ02]QCE43064.1 hypothetical protein E9099_17105 [Psychroserpens sp. NJDZ02]